MPTNGIAENILYSINGAPIFTYGMISLTAVILAYVTIIETPDVPNESPLEEKSTINVSPIPNDQIETQPESSTPEASTLNENSNEEIKETPVQEEQTQEEQPQEEQPQEVTNEEVKTNEPTQPSAEIPIKQGGKKKQSRKNKSNISKISKRKTRATHK